MIGSIAGKIVASVVSLSTFIFSSYTGNDPALRSLSGFVNNGYLQLSTALDYAFDNDFPDVFKSGTKIDIYYNVELKNNNQLLFKKTYFNSVQFNHMTGTYKIQQSGTGQSFETSSYKEMITAVSTLSCSVPLNKKWQEVAAEIEVWLPTVEFRQINRRVDLMVLWKFRKPSAKSIYNVRFMS
ncbi:MAG: hypothetical protein CVU48_10975 [Candidatus Cloacimonetes bacterium HGW-Cloacimonetes-1]|nr:MAG: hypothetical protein CVU48_10975 [Candidatus Cloacimonetes bacterium HGW-Cloacimonetes-1]